MRLFYIVYLKIDNLKSVGFFIEIYLKDLTPASRCDILETYPCMRKWRMLYARKN